ncbi:sensor histidine kinase [Chromobacterium subtsugae]|uniref:sensor histidine kinase n=1 Tax=Chromobacterium subtsugae TaxID=251747 RepID=UPI000640C4E5|nr:ATP-binding protein [Chromobacterium subtsugae]
MRAPSPFIANPISVETRLAQQLHDQQAQLLSLALIQLDLAASDTESRQAATAQARRLVKEALQATRGMIAALREDKLPAPPVTGSLERQCRQLAAEISRLSLRPISLFCAQPACPPPAPASALMLQAARELLLNACKHAPGADIRLSLSQAADGTVRIAVEDNGPGFSPAALAPAAGSLGLRALPARLALGGLEMKLTAAEGQGVRAELRWRPQQARLPRQPAMAEGVPA